MQPIDWTLIAVSILLVLAIGLYTQRYVRGVADFLSAGRVAKRYLLAVATGEMGHGAVLVVAFFEQLRAAGFSTWWWGYIGPVVGILTSISGFVMYRYRETRAMTLGQFYEIRYSKSFRLFTGYLAFFAGMVNFGIIPITSARFLVYLLGLPPECHVLGWTLATAIPLMGVLLAINLFITLSGGLITIMMTNCAEGIISQILNLALIFGLLWMFPWSRIEHMLVTLRPEGQGTSYVNPFDSWKLHDFNIWFIIIGIVLGLYSTGAWQNQSAYKSAPLTPHEGRMGSLMGRLRGLGLGATILLGLAAMTYLSDPQYAAGAAEVHAEVVKIPGAQMQQQMELPIAVAHLLPAGLKGALCVILILGSIGGDANHLHSWGSILIQDAILPFRKRQPTPREHLWMLRASILGVAVFAFIFGSLFKQTEYIIMWWQVSGAIYTGGAGVAILGGLYWKRGTAAAAWAGMITGSLLSAGGILLKQFPLAHGPAFLPLPVRHAFGPVYFYTLHVNGQQIAFFAMLIAVAVYVIVSILTCREPFNLERMLHRGAYAAIRKEVGDDVEQPKRRITWGRIAGVDENFTLGDKWIAYGLLGWSLMFVVIEVVGSVAYLIHPWPVWIWLEYWHIWVVAVPVILAVVMTVWFTWGGIRDAIALFQRLEHEKVNALDNGMVVDHQNLDESVLPDAASPIRNEAPKPEVPQPTVKVG